MRKGDARSAARTHGANSSPRKAFPFAKATAKSAPIDEAWKPDQHKLSDGSSDDSDAEEDEPPEETPSAHTTPQPKATLTPLTSIFSKQPARSTLHAVTELQKQEVADALRLKDAAKLSELIEKLKEIIAVAESRVAALSAEGATGRHTVHSTLPSCMHVLLKTCGTGVVNKTTLV